MPAEPPSLNAPAIFEILDAHDVAYVVVGGYAAYVHGSSRVTTDVDVTPERSPSNLDRLAAALKQMGGGIRVNDLEEGLPFDCSAESLAGMKMLNLRTPLGDIDLTFEPAGTHGYPDLARSAAVHTIGTVHVHVADLRDVIRSKTAAGRQKDLVALPELHELARRLGQEPGQQE